MSNRDAIDGFLAALRRIVGTVAAEELAAGPEQAQAAAAKIAELVCAEFARRDFYVPAAYDPRNREILAALAQPSRTARAYSPARIGEVAIEFAVTTRWVYALYREAREAELQARQGILEGFAPPTDQAP